MANTQTRFGSCLLTGFYLEAVSYGAMNLICLRMTMAGGKRPWSKFMLGHPLHSVMCIHIFLCAQYSALDLGVWRHVPLPTCLAKRNSFNTTILQAWFCRELSFFWHQEEHFKLTRKCNRLIYLDALSVSLTLARGGRKRGRENQNIMLHKACLYALGLAGSC